MISRNYGIKYVMLKKMNIFKKKIEQKIKNMRVITKFIMEEMGQKILKAKLFI